MIELYQRLGCRPRFCVWELTLACNMQCLHCGSHAGRPREDELSREDCLSVADQLAAMGCEKVTLSGGEPTLHPHWHEIGRRLSERGVRVNMISNGWTWSEAELERVRYAGLRDVAFSLDGLEAAHDTVRRAGSFRAVVRAAQLCIENELPMSVVSHINELNKRDLAEFRALLADMGVIVWQVQLGNPSGNMRKHSELVIPPEDLLWLVPELAAMCIDDRLPVLQVAENIGYFGKHEKVIRGYSDPQLPIWIGCSAGWQSVGIESNGNVKGCLSLPSSRHGDEGFVEGNLLDASLETIWQRPGAFAFNREFSEQQLEGFCACCRYRDICRAGCSWTAHSHTNTRFDNPYCFYRQAVVHRRFDLLDEEPTPEELAVSEPAN